LTLEVTESVLMRDPQRAVQLLGPLKALGVRLAIDDFGTGYSSFSYLRHFCVDKLKIDQTFIQDVVSKRDDAAITIAIIGLAKSLHIKVIAEGVENESQMFFLREHRCDQIQGHYFSKPVQADEAAAMLQSERGFGAAEERRSPRLDAIDGLRCAAGD
jgi:EAL domain-containing protein (putative c-di-GMP-specific phosphodiesterase class I)